MPTFRQDNKLGDSVPLIKTPDIGDKQVTERKLADGSVTSSKLSTEIANMLSLLTTRISAFKVADNLSSLPTEENTIGWLVDNHLYVYVGNGSTPESGMYQDCGELRGPQGIQGEQGLSGLNGKSAYDIWTEQPGNEDKSEIDFLEFTRGSKGDKGDQGERGYDISNIEQIVKSTEDGGKNIIRVTRSDGWSKVFEIFNGSKGSKGDKGTSIVKLEQTRKTTESSGLNTIEATLGDGTKESFEIYNGAKGEQGDKGEKGDNGDQGKIGPQGNSGIADASNKTLVNDAITGGETDFLSAEVGKLGILTYDCSKGGTVTHTTLQDAINSVPTTFQKVGLTITYKSGDTIYRYTLKANAWSADQTNWFSVEDKLSELSKSAYNYEFFCQAQTVSFKYGPSFSVTMHIVMYNGSKNLGYFYKKGSTIETYATLESDDVTFTLKNYSYLYVDLKDNKVKVSQEDLLSYDDRLVLLANFQAETLGFSIGLMAPYINTLKQNAVAKASYRLYSKSKIVVNRISQYQSSITISTDKKLGQIGWLSYDSINGLYLYNEGNELTKTYVLNHSDLLVANSEGILSVVSYSTYSGYPVGFTVLAYLHEDKIVGILNEYITSENASDKLSELSKSAYNYEFFCQAQTVSFKYGPSFSVTMHIVMYNGSKNLGYFYKKGSTIETYATLESDDVTFTLKNYSYLYVDLKDNKVKVSQEDLLSYDDRLVLLANFQAETLGFSIGLMAPYINTLKQNAVAKASYRLYSKSKIVVNRISQYQSSITISTDKKLGQIGWLSYDSINGLYLYNEGNELTKTYVLNHSDLLVANSEGILSVVSYSTYSGYPVGFTVLAYLHEDKIVGILNEYITSENVSDKLSELSKSAYNYDNIIRTIQRCGYSGDGAPFQSLQAYRDAIKHGFSILLADLMFTRDNVPVCSHDYYLNQYYSNVYNSDGNLVDKSLQIYIREKTYEELLAYDWGAGKYKGTKLLKFEDFVKFCKINGVSEMYVEIKELTSDIQASIACNIVKKYNMKEKTSFAADSKNTLKLILNHLPYTRVATMPSTIDDNTINELLSINNGKCKLFFFAWDTTTLSNDIVKKLIDNNIDFEFGTLNTKEKVKEYFNRGNIYLYCAGVESNSLHIGNILKELEI